MGAQAFDLTTEMRVKVFATNQVEKCALGICIGKYDPACDDLAIVKLYSLSLFLCYDNFINLRFGPNVHSVCFSSTKHSLGNRAHASVNNAG